ncbi:hypothetical protein C8J56DRAFT_802832 [Mycena floridula]|nr:hypothetical protein C8J56DRAFT_802832 [Mycena floridula]
MSLVSQSDLGSENYGIANGQTMLRQLHDPSLVGTLQHRWKREKKNVIPEIAWGQLRRRWTPGYETLIDSGIHRGWYDPSIPRHNLVFRWVFIPWLQAELDAYRDRVNFTAKRADRNKVLPHGVPAHIYEEPEAYECLDFKITVDPAHIRTVKEWLAPADHPVFELVPPSFHGYCFQFYQELGSPTITRDNVWNVYLFILDGFRRLDDHVVDPFTPEWNASFTLGREDQWDDDALPLVPDQELPQAIGHYYQGGVNGGLGV